jgi:hypothetical protein
LKSSLALRRNWASCACNIFLLLIKYQIPVNMELQFRVIYSVTKQENVFSCNEDRRRERTQYYVSSSVFVFLRGLLKLFSWAYDKLKPAIKWLAPMSSYKWAKLVILFSFWTMDTEPVIKYSFGSHFRQNSESFHSHYFTHCVHKCGKNYYHLFYHILSIYLKIKY